MTHVLRDEILGTDIPSVLLLRRHPPVVKLFAAWKSLPAFQSKIYSVVLCFGRSLAFMVCGDWKFLFRFLENFVDSPGCAVLLIVVLNLVNYIGNLL